MGPINKVKLFEKNVRKNRRLTPSEFETDLQIARWLKRPVRYYFDEKPYYPWCVPEPVVNFDLNYKH